MNKLLLFIAILTAFTACEKTIELDPRQAPERIVIEALVTDRQARHEVKISKTQPFGGGGAAPRVSGAVVQVSDDAGNVYRFVEEEPGRYLAAEAFAGVAGRTYTLRVTAGEEDFTASEELRPVAPIRRLEYRLNEEEQQDPEEEGRYYQIYIYLDEPQETEDYYLARIYRNGELLNDDGASVFVFEDRALGGSIEALPIGYFYGWDDTARIEVYSLTRRAYRFYADLQSNIGNDGGMFSGQPANVRSNIQGGALGYFQVSGLAAAQLQVN